LGIAEALLFDTLDVFEGKDMPKVLLHLIERLFVAERATGATTFGSYEEELLKTSS
jgi:hypothetical protein